PFGGIYLIGGVARAFAPFLGSMGFEESFRDLGRFGDFVDQFGIWMVEDDYAALTGCASHVQDLLQRPH
ncbi:MAG: glucokinase, partial [Pseudomonadota bacterium]|nr:glucokinase [Pseudomonadota bacterium]